VRLTIFPEPVRLTIFPSPIERSVLLCPSVERCATRLAVTHSPVSDRPDRCLA